MTTSPDHQHDVDYWRNTLNAIDRMLTEIPDTMLTISSYAMDLAGPSTSTEPPLPGGDALVLTGPWASDATHGDDTPHPAQTIVEWAHTIYDAHGTIPTARLRYAEALRYLRDQTPWILESPWTTAWRDDIEAVHGRLRALVPAEVDDRHDSTPLEETIDLTAMADLIPEDKLLTRDEAEHFWPNRLDPTAWATLRKRAQRAREDGHNIPHRRYPVEWIKDTLARRVCA
ncbi:hypothetical protein [Brachybacterium massiliense]|uniref:hypothetical protein n=1 Tax=Brachybacterium massiliense TaxID=1755098 RepID=UPI000B3BCDE9|nr:hypothetical protein [Brachybacterium massiliense]